jgi:hypothetical protein
MQLSNQLGALMIGEVHLFRFGYTSPSELAWFHAHPESDLGEFSEAVFIRAASVRKAEVLGQDLAEAFVRALYGPDSYSWRGLKFASWIDDDPDVLAWAVGAGLPVLESENQIPAVASQLAEAYRDNRRPTQRQIVSKPDG